MALTEFSKDIAYIQALDDNPNENDLTAAELKARFDQAGLDIKTYINSTLTKQIDTMFSGISGSVLSTVYPIGSIYISVNNTNPGTLFGGTWEQIQDTFLLSAGSTYTAGATGGEATHTLTVDEMPSHTHIASGYRGSYAASGNNRNTPVAWNSSSRTGQYTSSSTGEGQAHNNMPPYLVVYMWKRTG